MFIANDKNRERISIENAIIGEEYFCPICNAPLTIKAKNSEAVSAHFAHKKGTECLDTWSHDMSEWHREWQEKFPEQCREVVVEKEGIKHRADVLINNTVIEFQHSPITSEEIFARNKFYLSCGYRVVWVFDATDKIRNEYSNSIDPMRCRPSDLCWKRAKQQFSAQFQKNVQVYLQYPTTISTKEHEGRKFDILLLLKEIDSKHFTFFPTAIYILQDNFLREYGVDTGKGAYSVSQILSHYNSIVSRNRPTVYRRIPAGRRWRF